MHWSMLGSGVFALAFGLLIRRFGWPPTAEWLRLTGTPEDGPMWGFMFGLHHVGTLILIGAGLLLILLSFFLGAE